MFLFSKGVIREKTTKPTRSLFPRCFQAETEQRQGWHSWCEDLWQHNPLRSLVMKHFTCLASKIIAYQKICRQGRAKCFFVIIFQTPFCLITGYLCQVRCNLQTSKKTTVSCVLSFFCTSGVAKGWIRSPNVCRVFHLELFQNEIRHSLRIMEQIFKLENLINYLNKTIYQADQKWVLTA